MTMHLSASELAALRLPGLPSNARTIRLRAQREGWSSITSVRAGGLAVLFDVGSLPAEARSALELHLPEREAAPAPVAAPNFDTLREAHRAIALERVRIVGRVRALIAEGCTRSAAVEQAASEWRCDADDAPAPRTVRRWVATCKGRPSSAWFAVLVPQWRSTATRSECHPDAWAYFRDDYCRPSQPAAAAVYRRVCHVAEARGWSPIPSLGYFVRRLRAEVPRERILMAREGEDAIAQRYPAQTRDRTELWPMAWWCADGHVFDVFVLWPDGEVRRPVMVGFQDLFSSRIVGWRVDKTETADLIRLAAGDAITRCDGVPDRLLLDNGRGFASKWLTGRMKTRFRFTIKDEEPEGIFTALGIGVTWALPFRGRSKPIERAWRDLCENISRHPSIAGAYTGSNPEAKPSDYGSRAVPLADFLRLVSTLIDEHNARRGRRATACRGRSFNETFSADYGKHHPVRKLTDDQRRLLLLAAEGVKVRRGTAEIQIGGNRYAADALVQHEGELVVVRFDPDNLHAGAFVYRVDGRYIGFAACVNPTGFGDMRAAKEHLRKQRARVKAVKASLEAERQFSAAELGEMHLTALGAPAPVPSAQILRPHFSAPKPPKPAVAMAPTSRELADRELADELLGAAGSLALARLRTK